MQKLLLATNNPGKLREMEALLQGLHLELTYPEQLSLVLDVKETGSTYAENAALKAAAFAKASGLLSLADDSGLEVDALDGAPGLYSHRFSSKPGATDADRRVFLLTQLHSKPMPWLARFHCTVAISTPEGKIVFTEGICPGEIIPEERGFDGFGYDPIFFIPELGRTMAELSMEEKNQLSHRARAVRSAVPHLQKLINMGVE